MAKDYKVLNELTVKTQELHRAIFDKGYEQGYNDGKLKQLISDDVHKTECEKSAFNKGLELAWKYAKLILEADSCSKKFNDIFDNDFYYGSRSKIFEKYSASEAIAKIKEYEEKQKAEDIDSEIKTGDEVIYDNNKGIACSEPFPVVIDGELYVDVWFGDCMIRTTLKYVKKTGKHYYHMSEILKQLKGE